MWSVMKSNSKLQKYDNGIKNIYEIISGNIYDSLTLR
jgi:hypothetical protein